MKRFGLLGVLALASCATVPAATAGPTAAIGETASVGGITVRPVELLEDSRCPAKVQCIWAGRLRIQALIEFHGRSEEFRREMTLGEPVTLAEGTLTLVEAVPGTRPGEPAPPATYRFTFRLDR